MKKEWLIKMRNISFVTAAVMLLPSGIYAGPVPAGQSEETSIQIELSANAAQQAELSANAAQQAELSANAVQQTEASANAEQQTEVSADAAALPEKAAAAGNAQTQTSAAGVTWNGREWDGSIAGAEGERNCDIVSIGRESARTDSVPYTTRDQAVQAAVNYQKELSPLYSLLSRCSWKFAWYESPSALSAEHEKALSEENALSAEHEKALSEENALSAEHEKTLSEENALSADKALSDEQEQTEEAGDSGVSVMDDTLFYRTDFDDSAWEEIYVPSVWQTQGYDHPIYTNTTQKFARNFGNEDIGYPRDLPAAPTVYNPVGLYRHEFEVPQEWDGMRVYLDFEGVDSAFYVWVNGIQVGYAEDSFTTDEFDITDYVHPGQSNLIAVQVYRWCGGSWIEDQDFFDLSGIFRDVYIYAAPEVRVRDYSIITDFDESFTDSVMKVDVMVRNYTGDKKKAMIGLTLLNADGQEVLPSGAVSVSAGGDAAGSADTSSVELSDQFTGGAGAWVYLEPDSEQTVSFSIPVQAPRKWSAEDPYLYTLVLQERMPDQTVYEAQQVGFRKITYKQTASGWFEGAVDDQDLICINGKPISFRGVDRHETHPEYGYSVTREVMEEDIRIMLENNINAVRTSHYPNSPYWYYLCDKYGIYVLDEANQECHSNMIYENERITEYLSRSIIDREYNMVRRDRNHPCVVMWSLGNESKNPEILRTILVQEYPDPEGVLRVLHDYTKDRPWHYEQAGEMYETGIDVYSGMYVRADVLRAHGESDVAAPMIECEYEHAMGNSEGNFDEYWDAFDTYRNLQGGFIWDYVDQAIYAQAEDGTVYYGYGGDFGETVHDENFCANGLLLPDRTVQPEMAEVRYHYQPVKFENVDAASGTILIKNFFLFTDIAEKYEVSWTLLRDNTVIQTGTVPAEELHIPCVNSETNQPGIGMIRLEFADALTNLTEESSAEYFLNLSVCLKEEDRLLPAGYEIAGEQFELGRFPQTDVKTAEEDSRTGTISWQQEAGEITVQTENLRVCFDENRGCMTRLEMLNAENGTWRDLISEGEGPEGNFFRAVTDNDSCFGSGQGVVINFWKEPGNYEVHNIELDHSAKEQVTVKIEGSYPDLGGLMLNTEYTVYQEGFVTVQVRIVPQYDENRIYLPVAGVSMTVPSDFEQMTWFGRGPQETYCDRYKGTIVGQWKSSVSDNYFPYVRSTETGNHVETRWVSLTDETGTGLLVCAGSAPFEFSALHYTAQELSRRVHPYELEAVRDIVLRINAAQMGLGGDDSWSRDCTHEQYLLKEPEYCYSFLMGAVSADKDAYTLMHEWETVSGQKIGREQE